MRAGRRYCYPLTIADHASRYLIACEALHATKEACAFSVFENAVKESGLPELDYPFHDKAVTVTICGRICLNRRSINLCQVFAGQTVGIEQTDDQIWLVSYMGYDLLPVVPPSHR